MSNFIKAMKSDNILERVEVKNAPFSVPEGYFDNLPGQIATRVVTSGKRGGRKVSINRFWPVATAASLAAIAFGLWRFDAQSKSEATASADQEYIIEYLNVSDAQLADYDDSEAADITQEEIMEYLAYNGLSGEYIYDRLAEAE